MVLELIRSAILWGCFSVLVVTFAVICAYGLGNTEQFEAEEFDGPWGKGVIIIDTYTGLPQFFGGELTSAEQKALDEFYRRAA